MSFWITILGSFMVISGIVWMLAKVGSVAAILITVIGIAMIISSPLWGHSHDRPGLDDWYSGLKSGRGPCCDGPGKDAKYLESDDWESNGGHYRVRLYGKWIDVPDEAVLKEPNKDGRTRVWPIKYFNGQIFIRCFIPGMMG